MYTYLLLFFIIVFLLMVLSFVKGDFMHPCAIVLEVYLLSICLLITEIKKWDAYIDGKTFVLILMGLSIYIIVFLVTSKLSGVGFKQFKRRVLYSSTENPVDIIEVVNVLVCLFSVGVILLTFQDVRNIASSIGVFSTFGQMAGIFRDASVSGTLETGFSRWTRYGSMILCALSYVYVYITIQVVVLKIKKKKAWYFTHVMPIIMYMIYAIMTGSRNPILQILIAAITIFFLLHNKYYSKSRRFELKSAIKIFVIGCVILFLFSSMRGIVGRTSDLDAWDYIAKYVGAPIKLLDMYITYDGGNTSMIWGQETFVNVWKFIGHRIGNSYLADLVMNKEWRSINGFSLGNVYTAFREYYADFGTIGVIVLTAIHSFVFNNAYIRICREKHKINAERVDFSILLYAYLAQSLFYFSIDDRFYQAFLSYSTIQTILIMFVLIKIMPRLKFNVISRKA